MAFQNVNSYIQDHPDTDRQRFYSTYGTQASTNMVISREITTEPNKCLESVYYNNENIQNSMPSNHLVSFDQKFSLHATGTYPYSGLTSNFAVSAVQTNGNYASISDGIRHFGHYPQANIDSRTTYSYGEPTSHLIDGTNMMDVANQVVFIQNPLNTHYIPNKTHYPQKGFLQERINSAYAQNKMHLNNCNCDFLPPCSPLNKFDVTSPNSDKKPDIAGHLFQELALYLDEQNHTSDLPREEFVQECSPRSITNELYETRSNDDVKRSSAELCRELSLYLNFQNRPLSEGLVQKFSPQSLKIDLGTTFPRHEFLPDYKDDTHQQTSTFVPDNFTQKFTPPTAENKFIGISYPYCGFSPISEDDYHGQSADASHSADQRQTPGIVSREFIPNLRTCLLKNENFETPPSIDEGQHASQINVPSSSQALLPGTLIQKFSPVSPEMEFETIWEDPTIYSIFNSSTQHTSHLEIENQSSGFSREGFIQKTTLPTPTDEFKTVMSHSFRMLTPEYTEASDVQEASRSKSPNERICASRFYHVLTPDSIDASTNHVSDVPNQTNTFLLDNFHKEEISSSSIDEVRDMTIARRNMRLHGADSFMGFNSTHPTISKNENIIPKCRRNRDGPKNTRKKIRPTVSRNIKKTAHPPIDVQKPSSPNGENKNVSTFPKESAPTSDQIEALIRAQMNDYMTNLAAKEERFVEEMLAENPVIEKRRKAKSLPESSSSAKDQLRRKRAEACRKSKFNAKVRKAKMEYRQAFMGMELKRSSSVLKSVKETIDKVEAHLRSLGYSEDALQNIRDKAGFDQTSFAKSLELSKKWI